MPVSISEQTTVFAACILSGLLIGILYDAISAVRNGFKTGKISVFTLDCVFWIVSVIIFFTALQITCCGEVHWYSVAGMILGLTFYMTGISKFLLPPITTTVVLIKRLSIKFFGIISLPFFMILKLLNKPVMNFVKNAQRINKNFVKKTLEKIRRFGILLKKY